MTTKYNVTLTDEERTRLQDLIAAGTTKARKLTHARILLKADVADGRAGWSDQRISEALEISPPTIHRVRKTFVEEGLEAALNRRQPRSSRLRKLDGEQEAHLVALACGTPPAGHKRWTLRLLADKMVELEYVDDVSHETIRQVLKKTNLSPG
jgi:transposase